MIKLALFQCVNVKASENHAASSSLRKQLTPPQEPAQKCHTVTRHFTDLGTASNWLTRNSLAVHKNHAQKCMMLMKLLKQDVSPCLNFDKFRDTALLMVS